MARAMATYRPAEPHGPLEEVAADVFIVRGSYRAAPLLSAGRNMTVVRQGRELVVLNSVRLSDSGEAELAKLGTVRHVVRLGWFHGSDDPYFLARFGAEHWCVPGIGVEGRPLADGHAGPLDRGEFFLFSVPAGGEAVARLEVSGRRVLVTCDSIQNWDSTEGCSLLGGLMVRAMGFLVPAKVGPLWAKKVTSGRPELLRSEFARLLDDPFDMLLSGHGALLANAYDVVRRGVERDIGVLAAPVAAGGE